MNRWLALSLIILGWMAAGFAIFGSWDIENPTGRALPDQVSRIVSLAPNLTEILFALGLDEQTVGVTSRSNYPAAATKKPKMGTFVQPDIEAVIGAKPDLVVTLGFDRQATFAERLERIGYNCLRLDIDKVSELFEAIERIGAAVGKQNRARELASKIQGKLDRLSALVGDSNKVKVLWIVQRQPLRVAGRETFISEIMELAGGENAIGPTIHKYPPIGAEQVIASSAEVIIETATESEKLVAEQAAAIQHWGKSRFSNVPAVADNRIYVISPDTVSRLGPRLYEGVETVARCLRPELFAN